jgi:outer membrane protein assembly factor BamA
MNNCKRQILVWLCCGVYLFASAQDQNTINKDSLSASTLNKLLTTINQTANDTSLVVIADISVRGNKKTKPYIIEREIPFHQGDYIPRNELEKKLVLAQQQVMNTALFTQVFVYIESQQGNLVFINVDVKERWYLFPMPYFKLVDRNFNQWWVEQKASLNRVNYGIKFNQNNVTGRNDKLNVYLIGGYSRQVVLKYEQPFADKSLKHGYSVYFNFSRQREMNYITEDNKQIFYKQNDFVMQNIRGELAYLYRPAIKTRHTFRVAYVKNKVSDTILSLNPHYYPITAGNNVSYPEFAYTIQYYNSNYNAYPSKGFIGDATIMKRGISSDINLTQLQYHANYATPLGNRTFMLYQSAGMLKLPFHQPYYSQQMFGYGDAYFRGLEYYVMDGVAGIMGRATLHHEIFAITLKTPPNAKREISIPFAFYLKAGGDLGYVYSRTPGNNLLCNKLVYTETVGLDLVIPSYDVVFKFNYSFNQLGQSGVFFHVRTDF